MTEVLAVEGVLGAKHRGPLIGPDNPAYDSARALYNAMIDKRPRLIAQCVDAADVIAAVDFARDTGLDVAVRCGAHNGPGLGSVDDGLVIDLSQLRGVVVDPEARVAHVLGGTLLKYHGEFLFTRLVASGHNTNPWMSEAHDKIVMPGDLVGIDTDSNGFEGYVIDVSRTFLCGERATPEQKEAYSVAHECVTGMAEILKPGMTFGATDSHSSGSARCSTSSNTAAGCIEPSAAPSAGTRSS